MGSLGLSIIDIDIQIYKSVMWEDWVGYSLGVVLQVFVPQVPPP
jgi:hypothetical protein